MIHSVRAVVLPFRALECSCTQPQLLPCVSFYRTGPKRNIKDVRSCPRLHREAGPVTEIIQAEMTPALMRPMVISCAALI
jgi:hypothetical protein